MIRQNPHGKYLCYAIKIISFSFAVAFAFVWTSVVVFFSLSIQFSFVFHCSSYFVNIHEMPLSIIFQLFYLAKINPFFCCCCSSHCVSVCVRVCVFLIFLFSRNTSFVYISSSYKCAPNSSCIFQTFAKVRSAMDSNKYA